MGSKINETARTWDITDNCLCENCRLNPVGLCQGAPSCFEILNYENGLKHTPFTRDNGYLEPAGLPVN